MASIVKSLGIEGVEGYLVDVEIKTIFGQPMVSIVGLGDMAIKEAKERIVAAINDGGYTFPEMKIVINLAPSDMKKGGSHFDLPMALGILLETGQLKIKRRERYAYIGELSLNAKIRSCNGILPMVIAAKKADLTQQLMELEKKVQRLKIERDIYEKAAELIKKDKGINIKLLTNREKATIINALRDTYKLNLLLEILEMAKSSYSYQVISLNNDKYFALRIKVKNIFNESSSRYGYRRIHSVLKVTGITVSEKVVRSIMNSENLEVPRVKRKRYSSYKGEISPPVENIINRDFHADKINSKWLTDITEFHIPAGKVYLSPIIDCFDGLPVSWTIGTSPDSNLVNTMLHDAISTLKVTEKPIVHSDRGGHYRWPGWIKIMNDNNLTRSMSKKGCSPDNAACEGFFGRLKNEMFYGYSWSGVTLEEFIEKLDKYIRWYGEERIKLSLGGMSPLAFRRSLGLAA